MYKIYNMYITHYEEAFVISVLLPFISYQSFNKYQYSPYLQATLVTITLLP